MAEGISWIQSRDAGTYRLPGPQHLGWWAFAAMVASIILHIGVFIALDRMKIALHFAPPREISTRPMNVRPVESSPLDVERTPPQEPSITPPKETASLLEEVDLLQALPKDGEIDIKPDLKQAAYALQMKNPLQAGEAEAMAMEVSSGLEMDSELADLGREATPLRPAEIGQITVDPGAQQVDDKQLDKFTEQLIKRGAGGQSTRGALDGIASLDEMLDLPPNLLLDKVTMLPSDLLFDFNQSALRESAKVGLMKLALLMDRNPNLYCWIEGHTDLVGGDAFNLVLSTRRAEAVRNYLIESLRMDATKISTRGFGRMQPLVKQGTADEQALNRRVEIRMRNHRPPALAPAELAPADPVNKAIIIDENPPPPPSKAILVKPRRPLPVDDPPAPPRAAPVPEAAVPPPAEPPPPRATPRAVPVSE